MLALGVGGPPYPPVDHGEPKLPGSLLKRLGLLQVPKKCFKQIKTALKSKTTQKKQYLKNFPL